MPAALLFSLCLIAGAAGAQEMKMHRKEAGAPDKSGWMLAASTEGRFSVQLPLKFNDFTITEANPSTPAARTYTVGAKSSENVAVVATRIAYRKGAAAAREYFARFEKGQGLGAVPQSVTQRRIGQLRAVDLVLKRSTEVTYQRVVLLDTDLLLMKVDAPREREAVAQQLAVTFFDSLQVDAK